MLQRGLSALLLLSALYVSAGSACDCADFWRAVQSGLGCPQQQQSQQLQHQAIICKLANALFGLSREECLQSLDLACAPGCFEGSRFGQVDNQDSNETTTTACALAACKQVLGFCDSVTDVKQVERSVAGWPLSLETFWHQFQLYRLQDQPCSCKPIQGSTYCLKVSDYGCWASAKQGCCPPGHNCGYCYCC
ncbi:hypothetical protein QOT17_018371 [Balamuthia mandrillaris]